MAKYYIWFVHSLKMSVKIKFNDQTKKGTITFSYKNLDELDQFISQIK